MAIDFNFSSGQVDKGDTKTLSFTPKDADGAAVTPASVTATITAPDTGTDGNYTKADFTNDSGTWKLRHTFDEAGSWEVDLTVEDSAGNTERETGTVYVYD